MQLLNSTAKNFLSFRDFSYNYSAQGLTNIDGNDDDLDVKTGAGKSTFMDIPCYAFFGKTSKDLKADEVINWDIKKDMEVHFTFKKDDGNYEIHRYRKHKDHENDFYLVDPSGQSIRGKDARETQKILEGILGFNYDIFKKAVYFGQFDNTDKFLSSTDKEKKDLISTICDLSAYDEKLELVKAEMKEDSNQLDEIKRKHQILESSHKTVDQHLCITSSNVMRWNKDQTLKYNNLKEAKEGWQTNFVTQVAEIDKKIKSFNDNKTHRISIANNKILEWDIEKDKAIKEFELTSEKWIDNQDSLIRTMSIDMEKIEKDFKEAQSKYENESCEKIIDFSSEIKKIEDQIAELKIKEREGDKLFAEKNHLIKLNENLKREVVKEKLKIDEGHGSECPHCYQEITGEAIERIVSGVYE